MTEKCIESGGYGLPILTFSNQADFRAWLTKHSQAVNGIWCNYRPKYTRTWLAGELY